MRRHTTAVTRPDPEALATGVRARELRCDLRICVGDIARAAGWSPRAWHRAEEGLGGVDAANAVLCIVLERHADRNDAIRALQLELEAA